MIRVQVSELIRASKETLYQINIDIMSWPKWLPHVKSIRVVNREGNSTTFEGEYVEDGRSLSARDVQHVISQDEVEEEIHRPRYSARILYQYESVDGGTRLTVTIDVALKGLNKLAAPFIKGRIRRELGANIFAPLRQVAEKLPQTT